MKKTIVFVLLAALLLFGCVQQANPNGGAAGPSKTDAAATARPTSVATAAPSTSAAAQVGVLVAFNANVSEAQMRQITENLGSKWGELVSWDSGLALVYVSKGKEADFVKNAEADSRVRYAELDQVVSIPPGESGGTSDVVILPPPAPDNPSAKAEEQVVPAPPGPPDVPGASPTAQASSQVASTSQVQVIVAFQAGVNETTMRQITSDLGAQWKERITSDTAVVRVAAGSETDFMKRIELDSRVRYAELDQVVGIPPGDTSEPTAKPSASPNPTEDAPPVVPG